MSFAFSTQSSAGLLIAVTDLINHHLRNVQPRGGVTSEDTRNTILVNTLFLWHSAEDVKGMKRGVV